MNDIDRKILDFILKEDFNSNGGYAYTQLLDFINHIKKYYKIILQDRLYNLSKIKNLEKNIKKIEDNTQLLEEKISKKDKQFQTLCEKVVRKLTWKERIFGKVIL